VLKETNIFGKVAGETQEKENGVKKKEEGSIKREGLTASTSKEDAKRMNSKRHPAS